MKIIIPRETHTGETRVSIVPDTVKKLRALGAEVEVEAGLGNSCFHADEAYVAAGASVNADRNALLASGDLIWRLRHPSFPEVSLLKKGAIHISYLDPFREKALVEEFARRGISALSMEMIPRITRAQKMDVLSSQASLAGYVAVVLAAEKLGKILPMMMTPSGTIAPAHVLIVGAGVAGLQAIATAKRLGARVEAFDTRPVVEEQVKSLGAKFLKIDLGETGQTAGGYAKELTAGQIQKQREGMKKACAVADIVITTAQVFGKKAPLIITLEMINAMKPGSIVMDMAVETGGNVEGSQSGQEVVINGVKVMGITNLPGYVCLDASRMYANNLYGLIEEFWDKESKLFRLNLEDEIIRGCLVTHKNEICLGGLKY